LLLNFSRKIYCKNYNEVLIHLGGSYLEWERGAVFERKEGLDILKGVELKTTSRFLFI